MVAMETAIDSDAAYSQTRRSARRQRVTSWKTRWGRGEHTQQSPERMVAAVITSAVPLLLGTAKCGQEGAAITRCSEKKSAQGGW